MIPTLHLVGTIDVLGFQMTTDAHYVHNYLERRQMNVRKLTKPTMQTSLLVPTTHKTVIT